MIIGETPIQGVRIVRPERKGDRRGWLARTFCAETFRAAGLPDVFVQCSTTYSAKRGTVRGMHFQSAPHEEDKLVRCARGAMLDVALDLRPGSPTFGKHVAHELSAENGEALFIPKGLAHGFQTLADDTEVFYMMTTPFVVDSATGVRWDDAAFSITWPLPIAEISDRDRAWPDIAGGA